MTRLPPLRPHHWTLPRHERRWYHPMRVDGRHGPGAPKHYLTLYTGMPQVRIAQRIGGTQAEVDHLPPAADVRAARSHLRAYLRRIGVPGRIIREVCGWLHRGGRCFVTSCPGGAWRAAMAEVLP